MSALIAHSSTRTVVVLADLDRREVVALIASYGARLVEVASHEASSGTYWVASEAAYIADAVYARAATPTHSLLLVPCHYVCLDDARRIALATDAGVTDDEESSVCYLQVLLAHTLTGFGAE